MPCFVLGIPNPVFPSSHNSHRMFFPMFAQAAFLFSGIGACWARKYFWSVSPLGSCVISVAFLGLGMLIFCRLMCVVARGSFSVRWYRPGGVAFFWICSWIFCVCLFAIVIMYVSA